MKMEEDALVLLSLRTSTTNQTVTNQDSEIGSSRSVRWLDETGNGEDNNNKMNDNQEGHAPALARIDTDEVTYFVCKHRLVVGRESGHCPADISLKENSYISRAHIELNYNTSDGRWYLHCNGKNGIFIDSHLHKKGLPPTPVPVE